MTTLVIRHYIDSVMLSIELRHCFPMSFKLRNQTKRRPVIILENVFAPVTSFHVRVLLAFLALSTAAWYSPRWTNVDASRAKLDTLLYKSLAASYIPSS